MTELEVSIRKGTSKDAETIAHFNQSMALETESKTLDEDTIQKGVKEILQSENRGFYLVAETKSQIVGSLMITYEWSDWRNGDFWWIQSVYVRPEFRKQGIYRKLYHHVLQMAENQPLICGVRLYVEKENQIAQKVYQSLGMEEAPYLLFEKSFTSPNR